MSQDDQDQGDQGPLDWSRIKALLEEPEAPSLSEILEALPEPPIELPPDDEPALPEPIFTGGTSPTGANLYMIADGEGYLKFQEYLIADVLPSCGISMLFAPTTAGKTWLVIDWAVHIAAGLPWLGRPVAGGTVIYIAAESAFAVRERIVAAKQAAGIERNLPLFTQEHAIVFNDPTSHITLKAMAIRDEVARREWPPVALVVVDTYSACLMGSANDDDVANDFMRQFRTFLRVVSSPMAGEAATGLLIHHPGLQDTGRSRGSSALPNGIDTEIRLEPLLALDPALKDKAITLICKKMRNDVEFEPFCLNLQLVTITEHDGHPLVGLDGKPRTALVVRPLEGVVAGVEGSKRDQREIQRALRATRALGVLVESGPLGSEAWRQASEVVSISGWEAIRDMLLSNGKVKRIEPLTGKRYPRYVVASSQKQES